MQLINRSKLQELISDINHLDDYEWYGIRMVTEDHDDFGARIGDTLGVSGAWLDDEYQGYDLNGVCAIEINSIDCVSQFGGYFADKVLIIGSYHSEWGEDDGEIVMKDAKVIQVINLD